MRTYHDLPDPAFTAPSNLTIGNFDGVHLGHQALIRALIADAHAADRQAGVLTFHPHPAAVLRPNPDHRYLTTIDQRLAVFEEVGLDFAIVYPFSRATAGTPAREFMAQLRAALNLASLWVGPDFALGRNREGDVEALRVFGATDGYTVHTIDPQVLGNGEVRSGRIRSELLEGDVEGAARQLGRLYQVDGEVVDGAHRGRTIGFPTANLDVPADRLLPANGVYATWATVVGQRSASVTNIGVRPSFDNGQRTVETHLLDFHGDLYGQHLVLEFVARLRPEMRFPGIDALRAQIARDVAAARDLLRAVTRFYQELEHTADWAVRVWGDSLAALFEHAAEAMFELQGADLDASAPVTTAIDCQASDLEALLVAWLSELLYQSETGDVVYSRFSVEIIEENAARGFRLAASASGYPGRGPLSHVKAVTYYNLSIEQTAVGWEATITFDT